MTSLQRYALLVLLFMAATAVYSLVAAHHVSLPQLHVPAELALPAASTDTHQAVEVSAAIAELRAENARLHQLVLQREQQFLAQHLQQSQEGLPQVMSVQSSELPLQEQQQPQQQPQQQQQQHPQQQQQQQQQQRTFSAPVDTEMRDGKRAPNARQLAVVETFRWAWQGYKSYAWGHDELKPVSQGHSEWFKLGLTLVDALDTMYLMGLKEEFVEARNWVANDMNLDQDVDVNLFECSIRVLGGLMSTYTLSGDMIFLDRARELGERLLPAFNPQSNVPFSDVNLKTHHAHKPAWGPDSTTSEVTTIQLEFKELSRLTNEPKYADYVSKIMHHVATLPKTKGLVPIFINAGTGRFSGHTITFGARGDSYYEYLLKQWLQTGKTENMYKEMYLEAMEGVRDMLVKQSEPSKLTFLAELINNHPSYKMDHLVCYLPGTLALGFANGLPQWHMDLAKKLLFTCNEMYQRMATGLAPEIAFFNMDSTSTDDITVKDADAHNLLRPETVESLFILYRLTRDETYREWGWKIYQAFEKYCKVPTGGYSSLKNVKLTSPGWRDKMESFFLGETLKYLYLLFEDDFSICPLDKVVFNTEAHPLPIFSVS